MSDERKVLDYAKPARSSGIVDALCLIGAVICVFTAVAGFALVGIAGLIWWEAFTESPTRDRPYFVFIGGIVGSIGLALAGFCIRWFIHAIRHLRRSAINHDDDTPGQ